MLDLDKFRLTNAQRAINGFKTYHNVPDSFWGNAIAGEVGELCNMIKKIDRVNFGGIDGGSTKTAANITQEDFEEEIGGIIIYLDLFCSLHGINLSQAIINTFNSKSKKYDMPYFIEEENKNDSL